MMLEVTRMFGKKRVKTLCTSCNHALGHGQKVCGNCGSATEFMDFDERSEYEVTQWRRYQGAVTG